MAAISFSQEADANTNAEQLAQEEFRRWKIAKFNAARRRDWEELGGVFVIFT